MPPVQMMLGIHLAWLLFVSNTPKMAVIANPNSRPYIPFRTDPYDQPGTKKSFVKEFLDTSSTSTSNRPVMYNLDKAPEDDKCPFQFSLGVSRRSHATAPGIGGDGGAGGSSSSTKNNPMGIPQSPVIYPILPNQGPGRQVLYTTLYEHLDMLTPSKGQIQLVNDGGSGKSGGQRKTSSTGGLAATSSSAFISEGLVEHVEFPLLFESSAFMTSPVIADVNNDGILDAVLTDYHGGMYAIGLQVNPGTTRRYIHKAQTPRLYVRRQWLEGKVNETLGIDPYEEEKKREAEEEAEAARRAAEEEEAAAANGTVLPPKDERSKMNRFRAHEERPNDPYHSYFEYTYASSSVDHEPILRGVTADLLGQDQEHVQGLEERRNRKVSYERPATDPPEEEEEEPFEVNIDADGGSGNANLREEEQAQLELAEDIIEEIAESKTIHDGVDSNHRRLQEVIDEGNEAGQENGAGGEGQEYPEEANAEGVDEAANQAGNDNKMVDDGMYFGGIGDDLANFGVDLAAEGIPNEGNPDLASGEGGGDGSDTGNNADTAESFDDVYRSYNGAYGGDDAYPRYDDYRRYDDFYSGRYDNAHQDYYDDKHYVRLPPHILSTPVIAELPKLYSQNGETELLMFLAVSYYFDEDEYEGLFSYKRYSNSDHGDETEVQRGMYLANAIMIYHFGDNPRWGRQEHLDLSADHSSPVNTTLVGKIDLQVDNSKLGAFALASPTVADIDGDGTMEVIMGTSMGLLYVFDARNIYDKDNFPIQFPFAIAHRVLVEDVQGNTNLEMFVVDVGSNIACIDPTGNKIWHRNILSSVANEAESEVLGSSPMVMGDVNGDGILDLVILLKVRSPDLGVTRFLFAMSADTGNDLPSFPINLYTRSTAADSDNIGEDFAHEKLPPALLVDLHGEQRHISDYIKRNGTKWSRPLIKVGGERIAQAPQGGAFGGLHVVQPVETHLVVVEGGSGCTQNIEIGEEILSMVQADDVHGTNKLDLVVSTISGNVVTLESPAPFHPLNVWNNGELRSRTNSMAHGYSASQGIFVHEVSRQFRDIFGVYVPVTFEIFDNRPNIQNEPDKRRYDIDIKEGTTNLVFRKAYSEPGVYTERLFIPRGPGYYTLSIVMKTTHGLVYEDAFHIAYNVNYMDGFALLLWLPLTIATIGVFLMGTKKVHWDDDDYQGEDRNGRQGILGGPLPE